MFKNQEILLFNGNLNVWSWICEKGSMKLNRLLKDQPKWETFCDQSREASSKWLRVNVLLILYKILMITNPSVKHAWVCCPKQAFQTGYSCCML